MYNRINLIKNVYQFSLNYSYNGYVLEYEYNALCSIFFKNKTRHLVSHMAF